MKILMLTLTISSILSMVSNEDFEAYCKSLAAKYRNRERNRRKAFLIIKDLESMGHNPEEIVNKIIQYKTLELTEDQKIFLQEKKIVEINGTIKKSIRNRFLNITTSSAKDGVKILLTEKELWPELFK